ncbi:MAG: DNA repair protein RecO, partial [Myxococcota bacterium]
MPEAKSVEALVVGGAPSGDADRVVHLLTAEGRLAVFAPQAKRSRRRFAGALEPFTTIEAQLAAQKKRAGLPTLADATVRRARLALRRDLSTIALASYFSELGFRTAPEGQITDVTTLVEAAWDRLLTEPATRRLRRAFELRLMAELGYAPELDRCVACGVEPDQGFVDLVRGGLLCAIHRGASIRVGPKT